MSHKRSTRLSCNVNFTIHTVQLPAPSPDQFSITWKRGDHEGYTEKALCTDEGVVIFEKPFRCHATIILDKKNFAPKPKIISFVLYKHVGSSKKKFGKFNINISEFLERSTPSMNTCTIEGAHSKKSTVTYSINTSQADSQLNSVMDSEMTTFDDGSATEKIEDWDVSEAITDEDRERIQAFFSSKKSVEGPAALASFTSSTSRLKKGPPKKLDTFTPGAIGRLSSFMSQPKPKRQLDTAFDQPSTITDNARDTALELFDQVLRKSWAEPGVSAQVFNPASSAIWAVILQSGLLTMNDEDFDFVSDLLATRLSTAELVRDGSPLDQFLVLLFLLAIISNDTDQPHSKDLSKRVAPVVAKKFMAVIAVESNGFESVADSIIRIQTNNPFEAFVQVLDGVKNRLDVTPAISELISNAHIRLFDIQLVNSVMRNLDFCAFSNSINWKSFITEYVDRFSVPLPLFTEVTNTIQMASLLCSDPTCKEEIIPTLPNEVVLLLLRNQQPDDMNPIKVDTTAYESVYPPVEGEVEPLELAVDCDFGEVLKSIPADSWKDVELQDSAYRVYPFLSRYIKRA